MGSVPHQYQLVFKGQVLTCLVFISFSHLYEWSYLKIQLDVHVFTLKSNWMSMYLPNLLELLFLFVLALPKACKQ
jgi:hypothetical protein